MTFDAALQLIRSRADAADQSGDWPAAEWAALRDCGALRWALPQPYGDGLSSLDLHLKYEQLATASLAMALILTQRDGAAQTIEFTEDRPATDPVLQSPALGPILANLADDRLFATVGIAQLTTSRQGGPPALRR